YEYVDQTIRARDPNRATPHPVSSNATKAPPAPKIRRFASSPLSTPSASRIDGSRERKVASRRPIEKKSPSTPRRATAMRAASGVSVGAYRGADIVNSHPFSRPHDCEGRSHEAAVLGDERGTPARNRNDSMATSHCAGTLGHTSTLEVLVGTIRRPT